MKSLILATAAVLALGVGGAGAATVSGHQGMTTAPRAMQTRTSHRTIGAAHHRSLMVKEAQRALRHRGLYHGNIDGIIGPETRHALAQYQRMRRLPVTASLNHRTMEALTGSRAVGVGSSMHSRSHAITGQGAMGQTPPSMPSQTGTSGQATGTGTAPPSTTNTGVGTSTGTTK